MAVVNPRMQCVILFMKAPVKGQVKTRLASAIGDEHALELYSLFIRDTLFMLDAACIDYLITYYPQSGLPVLKALVGDSIRCMPQRGGDFGDRLLNSFLDAFSLGYSEVVLIGSDSPDLPSSIIQKAFATLSEADAVIGPAVDGGYYLIGFKRSSFLPEAFTGFEWSTDKVFSATVSKIESSGMRVCALQKWGDVDTIDDLKALASKLAGDPGPDGKNECGSLTGDYLIGHQSILDKND